MQDTILDSPSGWEKEGLGVGCLPPKKMNIRSSVTSFFERPFHMDRLSCFHSSLLEKDDENDLLDSHISIVRGSIQINALFEKIKVCEEKIVKKEEYQTLLDEIIMLLTPHLTSPSKDYIKLFLKMKKETPQVYAMIQPHLTQK